MTTELGMLLALSLLLLGGQRLASAAEETTPKTEEKPAPIALRIGVCGYEGHGSVWTEDLNAGAGEAVGLRVTHVWHRAPVAEEKREQFGFEVVGQPGDMVGKVDGVIIAEELPHRYRELAEPFIRAGVPTFLNRPLAATAQDAAALIRLGRACNNPVFAASLLAVDPSVRAVREQWREYAPLKVVNATGPSNHFYWYVPHTISALVTALGPGIEEVYTHDFTWDQEGVTFKHPLVVFFRYGQDAEVGPVRGTMQVVPCTEEGDWYGFRMKLYGHKESPEYTFFQPTPGTSVWMPVYEAMASFFCRGPVPLTDTELLEVPLVLDMVLKSANEGRAVKRSEYEAMLVDKN